MSFATRCEGVGCAFPGEFGSCWGSLVIEDPVDRLSLSPAQARHAAYSPLRRSPSGSVRAMKVGATRVTLVGVVVPSSFPPCPGTCGQGVSIPDEDKAMHGGAAAHAVPPSYLR